MRAALLAAAALVLAGCPSNLEEQSRVSKLRVLAVRADPSELVLPSDGGLPATTLTALAVEPSDAAISLQFALCKEIGGTPSVTLPCPGDAGIELPPVGSDSARLDLSDPAILAFAASVQPDGGGGGVEEALDAGITLLVGFTARSGAERLDGFTTLTLRTDARGPANANPVLDDLLIGDGGPIPPKAVVRLQPEAAAKDDLSEAYGYSFFATAGDISSLRSTDTTATGQSAPTWVEWTAPADGGDVRFWVVLRDGRGGTAWLQRSTEVR
jgi:hypothetical protein